MNRYKVTLPVVYKCYVFAHNEEEAYQQAKKLAEYKVIPCAKLIKVVKDEKEKNKNN